MLITSAIRTQVFTQVFCSVSTVVNGRDEAKTLLTSATRIQSVVQCVFYCEQWR